MSCCQSDHRSFCLPRSRFCVGKVKATGKLRVSSTAPYFVDDRLHCPEEDMLECRPLHLCVSLVPDEVLSSTIEPHGNKIELPANIEPLRSPPPLSMPLVGVEPDLHAADEEEEASRAVVTHRNGSKNEESEDSGNVVHVPALAARDATPAEQSFERSASSNNVQPTPWVLDICLVRE